MKRNYFDFFNVVVDGFTLFISYLIAVYLRFGLLDGDPGNIAVGWNRQTFSIAIIYMTFVLGSFAINNLYLQHHFRHLSDKLTKLVIVNSFTILVLTSVFYFLKTIDFSRLCIVFYWITSTLLLIIKNSVQYYLNKRYSRLFEKKTRVVVIGNGNLAKKYITSIHKHSNVIVEGYVSKVVKEELGRNLGAYEDLDTILNNPEIEEVVVALESHEAEYLKSIILVCEKWGTKVSIIPSYYEYLPNRPLLIEQNGIRLINLRDIPLDDFGNAMVKRFFDIIISFSLIVLLSPVMLMVVIGIKTTMPGPVFFIQERVGKGKKIFKMYKFRSMNMNDVSDTAWTTDEDGRKTAFGSFIRKFSIDELPQLFNVLKGDMSLIGPRPEIPYFVNKFMNEIPRYLVRQQVRPGITGLAQIHGYRGDTSIIERVKYDLEYIENWSFSLDMYILFKTAFFGFINSEKIRK